MKQINKGLTKKGFIIMGKRFNGRVDVIMAGFRTADNGYSNFRLSVVLEQNMVSQLFGFFEFHNGMQRIPLENLRVGVPLSQVGDINGFVRYAASQMGLRFDDSIKEHVVVGMGNGISFNYRIKETKCYNSNATAVMTPQGLPVAKTNRVKHTRLREANSLVEMLKASSRLLEKNSGYTFYE